MLRINSMRALGRGFTHVEVEIVISIILTLASFIILAYP